MPNGIKLYSSALQSSDNIFMNENANNATRVNHPLDIVVDAPVQVWLDCNRDYQFLG